MTRELQMLLNQVKEAMQQSIRPRITEEGTGGTYFLYLNRMDKKPV